jgi:N-acetylmuramoyl-L-alanine amidase
MKPLVIIDAGHGGKDPGCSNALWREKDVTLQISRYQYERFRAIGIIAVLTRNDDRTLDPATRTSLVRESGAKICLCNHINAGGGDGFEAIHSIHSDGTLARLCAEEMQFAGQNVRRVYSRASTRNPKKDYYFMHRDTGAVQTVILEYGFADSKKDDVDQLTCHWQRYAEAIVKAVCRYVGVKYQK